MNNRGPLHFYIFEYGVWIHHRNIQCVGNIVSLSLGQYPITVNAELSNNENGNSNRPNMFYLLM